MKPVLTALLLCWSMAPLAALEDSTVARPNVLFVLTDDQSCSSLGCYGGTLVATPHMDQLAQQGVRFSAAYVMPQCTPTRAALLSGQHTARNGMWHVIPWYGSPYAPVAEPAFREEMQPAQCRLPHQLRALGYRTAMAGKWHLTANEQQGGYVSLNAQAREEFGFDVVAAPGPGTPNEGDKWVDYLTDFSIDFIHQYQRRPWFLYLSHHTLHGRVAAPANLVEEYLRRGAAASGLGNATYLAAIEHLDSSIGRLMLALEQTNQVENTIVVLLADNGGVDTQYHHALPDGRPYQPSNPLQTRAQEFDSAPLRAGKGSMYEGGIRVPCILRWPRKVKANQVQDVPIHVVDWLPTLLAAAGASQLDQPYDGLNILPLVQTKDELSKDLPLLTRSLYWYLPLYDLRWAATPCAVVRKGDWKLIEFFGDSFDDGQRYHLGKRTELYNLTTDIGESRNLAAEQPERVASMQQELQGWMDRMQVAKPQANPHFRAGQSMLETRVKPPHLQPFRTSP